MAAEALSKPVGVEAAGSTRCTWGTPAGSFRLMLLV